MPVASARKSRPRKPNGPGIDFCLGPSYSRRVTNDTGSVPLSPADVKRERKRRWRKSPNGKACRRLRRQLKEQRARIALLETFLTAECPSWFHRDAAVVASLARIEKIVASVTAWRASINGQNMPPTGQDEAPR